MPPKPRYVPELDATRGIAALLVAGYHVCGAPLNVDGAATNLIAASIDGNLIERAAGLALWVVFPGYAAVMYFFVLSGFVLAMSLARERRVDAAAAWQFGVRRVFRVFPAVVAAVLAFVALRYATGLAINHDPAAYGAVSILRNMLLLDNSINGVTWSMQAELIATPLIFVCFALAMHGRISILIGLTLCLAALSFSDAWASLFAVKGISRVAPLYAFAIGVLACLKGNWIVERLGAQRGGPLLAAAVFAFFAAKPLFGEVGGLLMQVLASAAIIVLLAFGRFQAPFGLLRAPAAQLIGRVSYSFYLLHPLTIAVVWPMAAVWTRMVDAGVSPALVILGLWVATSAAILPLAMVSYRFVELPGNALGRWISNIRLTGATQRQRA